MYVEDRHGRTFHVPDEEEARQIRDGIEADPDATEFTDAQLARMRPLAELRAQRKQAISIRLSPEVLEHFKAGGPGWQTRIDAALRDYVAAHSAH
ncbi:hypothetical protein Thiowin_01398 [Thiorhodovibrio winogradskyi]|uniref:BrnA antitoxin of type II toxin-antitoxin system n=1 Tax=Thiorhodovibrio winogradskyi TaxID=77007 RepID=A0ABZ0S7G0_9GAMM|nr:BrnA antitoxin family protein [Thiorhodovibrio winogradskyi]